MGLNLQSLLNAIIAPAAPQRGQTVFFDGANWVSLVRTSPFLTASGTVSPATQDLIDIHNTTSDNVAITLSTTGCWDGLRVTLGRYNNDSSGPITILTSSGLIQNETGSFGGAYALPTTPGIRQVTFSFTGQGYWKLVSR